MKIKSVGVICILCFLTSCTSDVKIHEPVNDKGYLLIYIDPITNEQQTIRFENEQAAQNYLKERIEQYEKAQE